MHRRTVALLTALALALGVGTALAQGSTNRDCFARCDREFRRCDARCSGPSYQDCHAECNTAHDRCLRDRCRLRPPG